MRTIKSYAAKNKYQFYALDNNKSKVVTDSSEYIIVYKPKEKYYAITINGGIKEYEKTQAAINKLIEAEEKSNDVVEVKSDEKRIYDYNNTLHLVLNEHEAYEKVLSRLLLKALEQSNEEAFEAREVTLDRLAILSQTDKSKLFENNWLKWEYVAGYVGFCVQN